ncbi:GIY-YIG nuclease family protein [Actinoallomurus iriomotensis]|uniref:GIY-YIG nuclease family protein n=1 Tax=Actinoallomurus iriomotensis TaxID=478107 RepID=UPI003D7F9CE6
MNFGDEPHTLDEYRHGRRSLYVGITNDLRRRRSEHRSSKHWFEEATKITMKRYPNRPAALDAERRTIKRKRPLYNIQHNTAVDTTQLASGRRRAGHGHEDRDHMRWLPHGSVRSRRQLGLVAPSPCGRRRHGSRCARTTQSTQGRPALRGTSGLKASVVLAASSRAL